MGSNLIETKYLILLPSFGNDWIELRKTAAGLTKVLKIYISTCWDEIPILGSSITNVQDKTIYTKKWVSTIRRKFRRYLWKLKNFSK
jgi:hypothetical protein